MNRIKWLLVLYLLVTIPCCSMLQLDSAAKPSIEVIKISLQEWNLQSVTLLFDVKIGNPYTLPLPLVNCKYALSSQQEAFMQGEAKMQDTIPAKGSHVAQLPLQVSFAGVLTVLKQIKPGALIPYRADLQMSVDAPGVGILTLPISKEGELPIPAIPDVAVTSIKWSQLSLSKAEAILNLRVVNLNQFPVALSNMAYQLNIADNPVVNSSLQQAANFDQGQENILAIPISISPIKLGLSFFNILKGQGASYGLQGNLDCNTAFGTIKFPLDAKGETKFEK